MAISYNGLWKLLIDKGMKKLDLREKIGMSTGTLAKLSKNEHVALSVLERICEALDCQIGDIVRYIPDKK
jgi:DNA-binding Xre family transcriptional regulator